MSLAAAPELDEDDGDEESSELSSSESEVEVAVALPLAVVLLESGVGVAEASRLLSMSHSSLWTPVGTLDHQSGYLLLSRSLRREVWAAELVRIFWSQVLGIAVARTSTTELGKPGMSTLVGMDERISVREALWFVSLGLLLSSIRTIRTYRESRSAMMSELLLPSWGAAMAVAERRSRGRVLYCIVTVRRYFCF